MTVEKKASKEIIYSAIFIFIGVLALILGYGFKFQTHSMSGIAIGFTPTGIGMLLIYLYSRKNPTMLKNIELENEERNVFINTKAGNRAFWVSYWYVFIAVMFGSLFDLSLQTFCIMTLFFMPITYFSFLIIYHRKY